MVNLRQSSRLSYLSLLHIFSAQSEALEDRLCLPPNQRGISETPSQSRDPMGTGVDG